MFVSVFMFVFSSVFSDYVYALRVLPAETRFDGLPPASSTDQQTF